MTLGASAGLLLKSRRAFPWMVPALFTGDAALGPLPADEWNVPDLQHIAPLAAGVYLFTVSLQFDPQQSGNWEVFLGLQEPNTLQQAVLAARGSGPPYMGTFVYTAVALLVAGVHCEVTLNHIAPQAPIDLLPGSWWSLTAMANALTPPPPLGVWCESFVPASAGDADTLYSDHLERMNALSVAF